MLPLDLEVARKDPSPMLPSGLLSLLLQTTLARDMAAAGLDWSIRRLEYKPRSFDRFHVIAVGPPQHA